MTNPSDPGRQERSAAPGPHGGQYVPPAQPQHSSYGPGAGGGPGQTGYGQTGYGQAEWRPGGPEDKGFLGALLDTNFDHLVTPKLIRLCYVLALLLVTLSALIVLVIGVWVFQLRNGWLLGLLIMLSAPVVWIFEAVLVRIFMEAVVVRFKGVEHLRAIKDKI